MDDPIRNISLDHEEVSEFFSALPDLAEIIADRETWSRMEKLRAFFLQKVIPHFAYEEENIFIPLLENTPSRKTIDLILRLQKEHGCISHHFQIFDKLSHGISEGKRAEVCELLHCSCNEMVEKFLNHAAYEDEHLLPLIA